MQPQGLLLLGGTGFVGRQLLKRLEPLQREVYVIARNAHLLPKSARIECYRDSLDNMNLLHALLPKSKIVIHLACDSTPGSSASQPSYEINNLLPTLRFLEALEQHPSVGLLYISSGGTVYGNQDAAMLQEDTPLNPVSYYGAGKAAVEHFMLAFAQQTERPITILRPSNFYGPGQCYRTGFGIVATIFQHLRLHQPLSIWGDGEQVRDYLYIDDFLDLLIQLLDHQPTQSTQQVRIYNVGSEKGTTLNQLCGLIEQVTDLPILRQYQPARRVDVRRVVLECSKIRRDHPWSPRTDLIKGLTQTWQWFQRTAP